MQRLDPGTLCSLSAQAVQLSVAPVLNVSEGHVSTPLRAKTTFVPAALVEQYAAPSAE